LPLAFIIRRTFSRSRVQEMNFINEGDNAARADANFAGMRTALYIPKVLAAHPRVLVMEFIRGGRVDDLRYLAEHNIDRNAVALELSKVGHGREQDRG
jgi:aarF domain-containing kinase